MEFFICVGIKIARVLETKLCTDRRDVVTKTVPNLSFHFLCLRATSDLHVMHVCVFDSSIFLIMYKFNIVAVVTENV